MMWLHFIPFVTYINSDSIIIIFLICLFSEISRMTHNLMDVKEKVINVSSAHTCDFTLVAETDAGPSPPKQIMNVFTGQNRKFLTHWPLGDLTTVSN